MQRAQPVKRYLHAVWQCAVLVEEQDGLSGVHADAILIHSRRSKYWRGEGDQGSCSKCGRGSQHPATWLTFEIKCRHTRGEKNRRRETGGEPEALPHVGYPAGSRQVYTVVQRQAICTSSAGGGGVGTMSRESRPFPPLKPPRKSGDLASLKRKLWYGILTTEGILASEAPLEDKLKGVHALSQAASVYMNLTKLTDLEARVSALEVAVHSKPPGALVMSLEARVTKLQTHSSRRVS